MRRFPLCAYLLIGSALLPPLGGCQPTGGVAAPEAVRPPTKVQATHSTPAPAGDHPDQAERVTHWQCGDLRVASRIEARGGLATLHVSGRRLHLAVASSPAGGHYSDADGNAFVLQEGAATLGLSGDEARECAMTAQASPWYDAAMRGIAFRAVGSEPGWFVELDTGDAPTLRATLDYGERTIELANMQRTRADGAIEFRGNAPDGSPVVLSTRQEACADGMSGEQFEARAELQVGSSRHEGCGAFLPD